LSSNSLPQTHSPSLLRALVLRLTVAVVLALATSVAFFYLQFRDGVTGVDDQSIAVQVDALRRGFVLTPQGPRLSLTDELRQLYASPGTPNGYQLFDADGRLLESAGFAASFVPLPVHPARDEAVLQREVDERTKGRVLTATMSVEEDGQLHWLRVSRNLQDVESFAGQLVLRAIPELMPWLALLLLVMIGVVVATVHSSLEPLRAVSQQAAKLSGDRITQRLPARGLPREVAPLVQAVNLALDRLEADYVAQREFTAHAAHELRTPLAILRAQLDLRFTPQQLGEVGTEIESLGRVVEQLLCLAQLESNLAFESSPLDAYACAVEVARDIAPLSLAQNHHLSASTPDAAVPTTGNATLVRLVFRNLIENAIQHTPAATSITVSSPNRQCVVIEDDGPGIPPPDRAALFDRFRRGSNASGPGVGLGLAIARRIMQRMGGQLLLDDGATRGARFLLIFGPAPTASARR
jgi:two-component system, OmpR family, sensor histidine kinase TctE